MKRILLKTLGLWFLFCGVATAQPFTETFSTAGSAPGWTPAVNSAIPPNVVVYNGAFARATADGLSGNVLTAAIETAFDNPGVVGTPLNLDAVTGQDVLDGSFFFRDFTDNGFGGTVTFDHGFDLRNGVDRAIAVLHNVTDDTIQTILLANTGSAAPTVGNLFTLAAGDAGDSMRIGFIVVNSNAGGGGIGGAGVDTSNLGIDNVVYAANAGPGGVPEINAGAGTLPLAILGVLLLVIGDGRRRRLGSC